MAELDRRRFLAALGLAPVAVLVLTGCPGGEDEDDEGGEGGEED